MTRNPSTISLKRSTIYYSFYFLLLVVPIRGNPWLLHRATLSTSIYPSGYGYNGSRKNGSHHHHSQITQTQKLMGQKLELIRGGGTSASSSNASSSSRSPRMDRKNNKKENSRSNGKSDGTPSSKSDNTTPTSNGSTVADFAVSLWSLTSTKVSDFMEPMLADPNGKIWTPVKEIVSDPKNKLLKPINQFVQTQADLAKERQEANYKNTMTADGEEQPSALTTSVNTILLPARFLKLSITAWILAEGLNQIGFFDGSNSTKWIGETSTKWKLQVENTWNQTAQPKVKRLRNSFDNWWEHREDVLKSLSHIRTNELPSQLFVTLQRLQHKFQFALGCGMGMVIGSPLAWAIVGIRQTLLKSMVLVYALSELNHYTKIKKNWSIQKLLRGNKKDTEVHIVLDNLDRFLGKLRSFVRRLVQGHGVKRHIASSPSETIRKNEGHIAGSDRTPSSSSSLDLAKNIDTGFSDNVLGESAENFLDAFKLSFEPSKRRKESGDKNAIRLFVTKLPALMKRGLAVGGTLGCIAGL